MSVSAVDVGGYILKSIGLIPAMKLQKLVYYSQAWSLVWDDAPLFSERIEAWANGPVIPAMYAHHRLEYLIESLPKSNPDSLSQIQYETVNSVLEFYGNKSSQWLSDLTHKEGPWRRARENIPDGSPSTNRIYEAWMAEYYGSL